MDRYVPRRGTLIHNPRLRERSDRSLGVRLRME